MDQGCGQRNQGRDIVGMRRGAGDVCDLIKIGSLAVHLPVSGRYSISMRIKIPFCYNRLYFVVNVLKTKNRCGYTLKSRLELQGQVM
jgi:hypothetical protein